MPTPRHALPVEQREVFSWVCEALIQRETNVEFLKSFSCDKPLQTFVAADLLVCQSPMVELSMCSQTIYSKLQIKPGTNDKWIVRRSLMLFFFRIRMASRYLNKKIMWRVANERAHLLVKYCTHVLTACQRISCLVTREQKYFHPHLWMRWKEGASNFPKISRHEVSFWTTKYKGKSENESFDRCQRSTKKRIDKGHNRKYSFIG